MKKINDYILDVRDLKMYFPVMRSLLKKKVADVKAVGGVSFKLRRGETLGLVGESGCGKTAVGRCILRLYQPNNGEVYFENDNILSLPKQRMRQIRSKMALIFQDPYSSLDPRQSAGRIVSEPIKVHGIITDDSEFDERVDDLFRIVGLDPSMKNGFPHEFSGGQRQRIGIARALACEPSIIICDEPISALDVSIQAQVINLLQELQKKIQRLSYLFIAHDLAVVRHISDRVAVMYLGRIVEITDSVTLYKKPLHPYTQALLSAVPIADPFVEEKRDHIILEGEVPTPLNPPMGCAFHPRCTKAGKECMESIPPLRDVGGQHHEVACQKI